MLVLAPNDKNSRKLAEILRRDGCFKLNHPIEFMRLTLTYEGPLPAASRHHPRSPEKHEIRKQFHQQLREVWLTHPALGGWLEEWRSLDPLLQLEPDAEKRRALIQGFDVSPYRCVPLVTRSLDFICELDILFLRREPPGVIVNKGGDIDNRMKVLFDALRIPQSQDEIPLNEQVPEGTELFCLLEDDALITRVNIESERLLGPSMPDVEASVKLVIRATVKAQRIRLGTMSVGGDF